MKIALIVGHDYSSRGAYGSEGISEWNFNDTLINDLFFIGLPKGNKYERFYRDADIRGYTKKMKDLHKRVDKWGADVSIEFHFNACANNKAQGHEVLYCSKKGKRVAALLNHLLDDKLPTSNRGIKKVTKKDRGGGFCCRGKSISIIVEPFFGVNQYRFIHGGDLRHNYIKALKEFFEIL